MTKTTGRFRENSMMSAILSIIAVTFVSVAIWPTVTLARPVLRGGFEICATTNFHTTQIGNGIERCCAHEWKSGDTTEPTGRYYCVTCRPPGSQNCEEDYPFGRPAPGTIRDRAHRLAPARLSCERAPREWGRHEEGWLRRARAQFRTRDPS